MSTTTAVRALIKPDVGSGPGSGDMADPTLTNPNWDTIDGYCPALMNGLHGTTGCKAASLNRLSDIMNDTAGAATSGQPRLFGLFLPAGLVIAHMTFWAGTTAGATMTHSWATLADSGLAKLAVSNDITTAAWTANTSRTFDISYTVPSSAFYYFGYCVVGTTMPTIAGTTMTTTGPRNAAPKAGGNSSTTGLTTPGGAPSTYGAITTLGQYPYCEFT